MWSCPHLGGTEKILRLKGHEGQGVSQKLGDKTTESSATDSTAGGLDSRSGDMLSITSFEMVRQSDRITPLSMLHQISSLTTKHLSCFCLVSQIVGKTIKQHKYFCHPFN